MALFLPLYWSQAYVPWTNCSCNEVLEASKRAKELGLHQAHQTNKQDIPLPGDKAEKFYGFCQKDSQSEVLIYFSYQEWSLLKIINCWLFACLTLLLLLLSFFVPNNSFSFNKSHKQLLPCCRSQSGSIKKSASPCTKVNALTLTWPLSRS